MGKLVWRQMENRSFNFREILQKIEEIGKIDISYSFIKYLHIFLAEEDYNPMIQENAKQALAILNIIEEENILGLLLN